MIVVLTQSPCRQVPQSTGRARSRREARQTGPRSVKIFFNEDNPELALLAGMRPILKKSQWNDSDFENSSLEIIPISTAVYRISEINPGKSITMERNPDYWGNDLPFRKGTLNFDKISLEYFGDSTVLFEACTSTHTLF